ncbi:MAG: ATP synthase F0 subunit C [Planctomycetes bacterium RIFOXYB12_FULL_42_10]|nr:MAG: ATP synthase F0 subunit C [Planctomycetes bacterium GWB2_41_19]OHC16184.1 MAG: ATP synthase F0 subunit C [Planctomycetes bacterium RIFOXYB12_FULL_42_10]
MTYFAAIAIAVALIVVAIFGCALGQGRVVSSAVEGMARQPAVAAKIQLAMIIGLAFIESLTIYSLMLSFILIGKLPPTKDVLEIFKQTPKQELLSSAGEFMRTVVKN